MMREEYSQIKKIEKVAFSSWSKGDGWKTFTAKTTSRVVDFFYSKVESRKPLSILEVGCGTGDHTHYLLKNGNNRVVACDLSESCVRATKSKSPEVLVLVADAEFLPFQEGSFHAVFLGSLLHHFSDITQILKECKRVLGNRGLFFAFDPNRDNPIIYFYRVILGSRAMKTDNEVLYSRKQLTRSIRDVGFKEWEVDAAIPIYFTREYYTQCLGSFMGHIVYLCNFFERLVFTFHGIGKYTGSFLISRAKK